MGDFYPDKGVVAGRLRKLNSGKIHYKVGCADCVNDFFTPSTAKIKFLLY